MDSIENERIKEGNESNGASNSATAFGGAAEPLEDVKVYSTLKNQGADSKVEDLLFVILFFGILFGLGYNEHSQAMMSKYGFIAGASLIILIIHRFQQRKKRREAKVKPAMELTSQGLSLKLEGAGDFNLIPWNQIGEATVQGGGDKVYLQITPDYKNIEDVPVAAPLTSAEAKAAKKSSAASAPLSASTQQTFSAPIVIPDGWLSVSARELVKVINDRKAHYG
jgi:hypothetical protein